MRAHEFVTNGNNLETIIQSFVASPTGQKYKQQKKQEQNHSQLNKNPAE